MLFSWNLNGGLLLPFLITLQVFWCSCSWSKLFSTNCLNHVCFVIFKQLSLERELIKVQGNLEAEVNMRSQANSSKADIESKLSLSLLILV